MHFLWYHFPQELQFGHVLTRAVGLATCAVNIDDVSAWCCTQLRISPGNISMELPSSIHLHKYERMAHLLNLIVEGSTPWQRDVAKAVAYTPQSVLFVCCSTCIIWTSMHSATCVCNRAAICCLVVNVIPLKRLSYSFTAFWASALYCWSSGPHLYEEPGQILFS